jgi:hypothetical protein
VSSSPFQDGSSVTSSLTPAQGLPARKGFRAWTQPAKWRSVEKTRLTVAALRRAGVPRRVRGAVSRWRRKAAVTGLVQSSRWSVPTLRSKNVEVASFGGAGVVALGLSLQLLVDPPPGGKSFGVLAAEEGDQVALGADRDGQVGGVGRGGFGLSRHGSNLMTNKLWSFRGGFSTLTGRGIGALDGLTAARCGPIGAGIRASGDRTYSVFALRSANGLLFRPFYGEAQPRLLLGPRSLAARWFPPLVNGAPGEAGVRPTSLA